MRLAALLLLAVTACIEPSLTECPPLLCPSGTVCLSGGGCAYPEQLTACTGKADGEACTFRDTAGSCVGGVCQASRCGDGVVDATEQCDAGDANADTPNAPCRTTCVLPACGDRIVDDMLGEACDDGNHVSGDGCRSDCLSNETCGNGVIDLAEQEECDDGNNRAFDGCSGCRIEDAVILAPGGAPPPRALAGLVYDGGRQRVVLFGGSAGTEYFGDTWEWDGTSWTQMHPRHSPPRRSSAQLAYDPIRHVVVMYGGYFANVSLEFLLSDTWEYDGVDWTKRDAAVSVGPRTDHSLAFDAKLGQVVLFGGSDAMSGALDDFWEWNGTTWSQITTAHKPSTQIGQQMAYDAARTQLVLVSAARTYTFDGTDWTDKAAAPASTAARNVVMAFDAARGAVLLVDSDAGAAWEWNGTAWTAMTDLPPSGRTAAVLAYDVTRKQAVLFGGTSTTGELGQTWLRTTTTWGLAPGFAQPSARFRAAAGFDPARGRLVLFGGADLDTSGNRVDRNDTWEWDGRAWKPVTIAMPPAVRGGATIDYDLTRRTVFMVGGEAGHDLPVTRDIYTYDGSTWSLLTGSAVAGYRNACSAYDEATDSVITFGGQGPNYFATDAMAQWNQASWQDTTPAILPPPRRNAAMAFDRLRQRLVMFGGVDQDFLDDLWEWDGTAWIGSSAPGPGARMGHALVFNPDRGRVVAYGNSAGVGYSGIEDLWEWSGAGWTHRALDASPPSRYRAAITYDAVHHELVVFGGRTGTPGAFTLAQGTRLVRYRPWSPAEACTSAQLDYDNDGAKGCNDDECWSRCAPLCPPGVACPAGSPRCGDGTCSAVEDCSLCPDDCGACTGGVCGDFHCDANETHASCPFDCI